ncbi:MAG: hypothetical protein Q9225_004063 [Loekoesia sp. 1 TL-2023]
MEAILSSASLAQDEDEGWAHEGLSASGTAKALERIDQYVLKPEAAFGPSEMMKMSDPAARESSEEEPQVVPQIIKGMSQLRRRQTEMKKTHDLAVAEIGRLAEQAKRAEAHSEDLVNDLMDDEADLNYLKLKLRILEIQTLPFVPLDDYDGLAAGIQRWKSDWAEVHRRQRRRRWKRDFDLHEDFPSWPF